MRLLACCALAVATGAFVCTTTASGANATYPINANGFNEVTAGGVPNQGDADGSAIGTITLDNGTGSGLTGFATINLSIALLDGTLSGHHIHQAPATTTGPIVIDFGNPNTILIGTPTAGILSGTITGLPAGTITGVFADPTAFYYNLHSTSFPGGAVRNQLPVPEPASLGILTIGLAALIRRRR
jgi:hypothetical protein